MKNLKELWKKSSPLTKLAACAIPYYIGWSIYYFVDGAYSLGVNGINTALLWGIILLAWRIIDGQTETIKIQQVLTDQLFKALNNEDEEQI